jgi:rhodanese-related sulfurtransferase
LLEDAINMKSIRRQFAPRRWNATGWFLAALVAVLLFASPLLSACSSNSGDGAVVTTATTGGSSQAGEATSSTAAAVGAPGPEGVGIVVASSDGSGTYVDITPDELATMLKNKDFLFINVHIPYEGEIDQTDLFLPYDQAAQQVDQLPADKNAKIVVYCRSDRMSRISVEEWVKAGYTNIYNLDGGFEAWEAAGYELLHK